MKHPFTSVPEAPVDLVLHYSCSAQLIVDVLGKGSARLLRSLCFSVDGLRLYRLNKSLTQISKAYALAVESV